MFIIFFLVLLTSKVVFPITHDFKKNESIAILNHSTDFLPIAQEDVDDQKSEVKIFHQSYRMSASTETFKQNKSVKASFLDRGSALSLKMRQMANTELGVTFLQDTFNSLPYDTYTCDEDNILVKMVDSLNEKLKLFTNLVNKMTDIVEFSYREFEEKRQKMNNLAAKNLILDFGHGGQGLTEQQEYYPCCVIPDHYLIYDPHFGTRVNTELWCDSGLEQERHHSKSHLFYTPAKLTESFSMNHHSHPNLKWQFFMSASGVHTEFPAHRAGTSVGSDCGQSSRHHQIYEKTIRPNGRNIVLIYELGQTLGARLLLTAKGIGHYIVDTLTEKDKIAILAVTDAVLSPNHDCMKRSLVPATVDVKSAARRFIDYLEATDAATNHTLGFIKALDMIDHWSRSENRAVGSSRDVLVIYVTRALLTDPRGTKEIIKSLGRRVDSMSANVIISVFGLGSSIGDDSIETETIDDLVSQNYDRYGITVLKRAQKGQLVRLPTTLRVAPLIKGFYDVVQRPEIMGRKSQRNVTISDVYWDDQGQGMVVTFSKAVFSDSGEVVGVAGIDVSLAYLLEDATYFTSLDGGYVIVTDGEGSVLSHPKIGRSELLDSPLMKTPVTLLEDSPHFANLAPHILLLPSGHKRIDNNLIKHAREYWWRKCDSFHWTFIISRRLANHFEQKLSSDSQPLPSNALFHRLDLLSPQEARVCRHFNQMATLDGASLFLSPGSYISPLTYVAKSFHNLNVDVNEMAHLKGEKSLPGSHRADIMRSSSAITDRNDEIDRPLPKSNLKEGVKAEASALYKMADRWKELFHASKLQKYIIRRYGATVSGVMLMYPGTLMDASYDPTVQGWYFKATQRPGEVVVSPPFLDPGGAGYIITVSHTVYQGRSASLHSSSDPVMAVVAADFTLGYWHKLLADIEPLCANSIFFKDNNESSEENDIRCFLMDDSGYLIAHPSFLDPVSLREAGSSFPRHITHQESSLSMSLLGKNLGSKINHFSDNDRPILEKIWCGKQWRRSSERFYRFNIKPGQVVASEEDFETGKMKNERSCLQYKITRVPSSNLLLGIINQTCSPPTTFCPCSTVDRPCLNCQQMETGGCECPCECAMPSDPCSERPFNPLTLHNKGTFEPSYANSISNIDEVAPRSCPPSPENPSPLHYGVGMLAQLNECQAMHCAAHANIYSCMGVLDCVWCALESDARTSLDNPYCTHAHKCYGGVRGGPSPYPPGLAPLPRSEERGSVLPILPVVGGVMVVFLVMGLTIYFYRVYTAGVAPSIYTPSSLQSHIRNSPLYPIEAYPDLENGDDNFIDERIMSAEAAAAMSPYRMNPTYRRPTPNPGDASDHGYSTMTPHEESDHLTDLVPASSLFPSTSLGLHHEDRSVSSWFDSGSTNHYSNGGTAAEMVELKTLAKDSSRAGSNPTFQSPLSSPKRIGPNRLIVPVTVHMVDTV